MTAIRVLVGTRKGAFILTSDGKRNKWSVSGPHFAGWEIYHLKGSPADPDRIYASQSSDWFGQIIQRSSDGGKTWEQPASPNGQGAQGQDAGAPGEPSDGPASPKAESNKFVYDISEKTGRPLTTHQWYDGTQHPWEFKRVWHLEPSLTDPDVVYAGAEDAALFRTADAGQSWHELSGLRTHGTGSSWSPGAGGLCLHTIVLDPTNANRILLISFQLSTSVRYRVTSSAPCRSHPYSSRNRRARSACRRRRSGSACSAAIRSAIDSTSSGS